MSSDSSDTWKFSEEQLGATDDESVTQVTDTSGDGITSIIDPSSIILLPMLVAAVYAFADKAVTLSAIETLIGTGTLATALNDALYIAGAITVSGFALLALFGALCTLIGLFRRSVGQLALGMIIGLLFTLIWAGATFIFGQYPLLVGGILTVTVGFYATIVLVALAAAIGIALSVEA
jgi:hypothetical protein